MREISFLKGVVISAFDGIPTGELTPEMLEKVLKPVNKNKLAILDAAFDIERIIDTVISKYFFNGNNQENKNKTNFESLILHSDWCSFSSKKKLISHIINDLELLKGENKQEYDQLLRKTMSYRNAFAHGELSTNGKEVRLRYFEGVPRVKTLSEEYFQKIEEEVSECIKRSFKVKAEIFKKLD